MFPPPPQIILNSRIPHLGSGSCSLTASLKNIGVWMSWGLLGSRFSFFLEPKGCGAMAPAQDFMGHHLLVARCPKAPQFLHFTWGWGRSVELTGITGNLFSKINLFYRFFSTFLKPYQHSMWDLCSLTRDQIHASCNGSMES